MIGNVNTTRRQRRKSNSNPCKGQNLQKPNGVIGHRVQKVGGEKFAIVGLDRSLTNFASDVTVARDGR